MNSLEDFISEFGCETENAMMYLSQIVEAVSFLHKRRFIHRNLRTASVFIYLNGNVSQVVVSTERL
jgi:serine/threonine protein kinase